MYCKFCGNKIAANSTKCVSCGAKIDLTDGGQSFFDDNELDAWQSDNDIMRGPRTSMPRTEMREVSANRYADDGQLYRRRQYTSHSTGLSRSRTHKKKKNLFFNIANLSNANRLIVFCITSVLAIVLLVVAIVSVIIDGTSDEQETQNAVHTQQVEGETTENGNVTPDAASTSTTQPNENDTRADDKPEATPTPIAQTNENENVPDKTKDRTEIRDIKVMDEQGKRVAHSVPGYNCDGSVYLSIDRILLHMGYGDGQTNKDEVTYEHKISGKVVKIKKGTNQIWVKEAKGVFIAKRMLGETFNETSDTYVPIRSLLGVLGYDENEVEYDEAANVLYFKKSR